MTNPSYLGGLEGMDWLEWRLDNKVSMDLFDSFLTLCLLRCLRGIKDFDMEGRVVRKLDP